MSHTAQLSSCSPPDIYLSQLSSSPSHCNNLHPLRIPAHLDCLYSPSLSHSSYRAHAPPTFYVRHCRCQGVDTSQLAPAKKPPALVSATRASSAHCTSLCVVVLPDKLLHHASTTSRTACSVRGAAVFDSAVRLRTSTLPHTLPSTPCHLFALDAPHIPLRISQHISLHHFQNTYIRRFMYASPPRRSASPKILTPLLSCLSDSLACSSLRLTCAISDGADSVTTFERRAHISPPKTHTFDASCTLLSTPLRFAQACVPAAPPTSFVRPRLASRLTRTSILKLPGGC